jgi:hypothetical protein
MYIVTESQMMYLGELTEYLPTPNHWDLYEMRIYLPIADQAPSWVLETFMRDAIATCAKEQYPWRN